MKQALELYKSGCQVFTFILCLLNRLRNRSKMVSKAIIICTLAFIGQAICNPTCCKISSSKLISSPMLISSGYSSGKCESIVISNSGGDLLISSIGPIAPSGIAVATELGLAGDLELSGELPYLSAVEFEGTFPTNGLAAVSYGCGDCVAITQEIGNPTGVNANINSGSKVVSVCGCGKY
ncbi:chorion class B protein PC10-like [Leguminivora glycinivorella]|uniref:chorion class B protein PC10-like n=1 Tax=Leguminivora glycinivorella TaxID=1035111 RepID=UPI00200D79FA|nr:chorion class B protein PC10-like [Leguminivora glycinivorella]